MKPIRLWSNSWNLKTEKRDKKWSKNKQIWWRLRALCVLKLCSYIRVTCMTIDWFWTLWIPLLLILFANARRNVSMLPLINNKLHQSKNYESKCRTKGNTKKYKISNIKYKITPTAFQDEIFASCLTIFWHEPKVI